MKWIVTVAQLAFTRYLITGQCYTDNRGENCQSEDFSFPVFVEADPDCKTPDIYAFKCCVVMSEIRAVLIAHYSLSTVS